MHYDFTTDRKNVKIILTAKVAVKMNKTGNPYYGKVEKLSVVEAEWGFNYKEEVQKNRDAEGITEEFVPLERIWGTRVISDGRITPLIEHKGKRYVALKVTRSISCEYLYEGKPIAFAEIEKYLPAKKEEGQRQGTETKVRERDYSLENIIKVEEI